MSNKGLFEIPLFAILVTLRQIREFTYLESPLYSQIHSQNLPIPKVELMMELMIFCLAFLARLNYSYCSLC